MVLDLRRMLPETARDAYAFDMAPGGIMGFSRAGGFRCAGNLTGDRQPLSPGKVFLASEPGVDGQRPRKRLGMAFPVSGSRCVSALC